MYWCLCGRVVQGRLKIRVGVSIRLPDDLGRAEHKQIMSSLSSASVQETNISSYLLYNGKVISLIFFYFMISHEAKLWVKLRVEKNPLKPEVT